MEIDNMAVNQLRELLVIEQANSKAFLERGNALAQREKELAHANACLSAQVETLQSLLIRIVAEKPDCLLVKSRV
jgi:hypothetical protein